MKTVSKSHTTQQSQQSLASLLTRSLSLCAVLSACRVEILWRIVWNSERVNEARKCKATLLVSEGTRMCMHTRVSRNISHCEPTEAAGEFQHSSSPAAREVARGYCLSFVYSLVILSVSFLCCSLLSPFVITSASCSDPATHRIMISPARTDSRTKWWRRSICFVRV